MTDDVFEIVSSGAQVRLDRVWRLRTTFRQHENLLLRAYTHTHTYTHTWYDTNVHRNWEKQCVHSRERVTARGDRSFGGGQNRLTIYIYYCWCCEMIRKKRRTRTIRTMPPRQWRSKSMANCVNAKGANYKMARNFAKVVFLSYSKIHNFPLHFLKYNLFVYTLNSMVRLWK
jgi:hypothetical protein